MEVFDAIVEYKGCKLPCMRRSFLPGRWEEHFSTSWCFKNRNVWRGLRFLGLFLSQAIFWQSVLSKPDQLSHFFIYLTNWSLFLTTVWYLLVLFVAEAAYRKMDRHDYETMPLVDNEEDLEISSENQEASKKNGFTAPLIVKIAWDIGTIILVVEFFVTVLFWCLVFPKENQKQPYDFRMLYFTSL